MTFCSLGVQVSEGAQVSEISGAQVMVAALNFSMVAEKVSMVYLLVVLCLFSQSM